ncbi:VWA domain-containing protein [Methylogaea oryzae]|uniref:Membrane protein n=2 Tax=Methylogaea oryzae TaxID=1295382 RepID=A0A8D5AIX4_9GAMM|nr:VWA domain-containing protein [Methylogaea oryzae]BBL69466.1 membrane protein [Methylogaea oryzae]
MNALADFHFLRPFWLLALPLQVLLLWLLHRRKLRHGDWAALCDPWLLPHVVMDRPGRGRRFSLGWVGLAGSLALLALAGPAWEREPAPAFRNEQALVIALDLSVSMDAADIKPSRLERARFKIADLLQARKDGQTALIAYAGDAFTVTPLTDDGETIRAQLGALSTSIMPAQGERAELALQQAEKLLRQAGLASGHVLLIGDGVDGGAAQTAAAHALSQGYRVSVLGVGTEQGAPVVMPGGGFYKDAAGAIVLPKLDGGALQAVASAGGGRYLPVAGDDSDVKALTAAFDQRLEQEAGGSGQTKLELWKDQGPWLLLPLLPLAALAFRRGLLAAAGLVLLLPWPNDAAAFEWRDLWQTPDQQGQQAMQQQNYGEAAERFRDPAWKGAAYYRAGQYEQAAEALAGLDDAEAHYNRGNALAQAGKYPEAIAEFDKALKQNPQHADARHNKEEVEKQRQQQKQHDKNQQGSKDSQNKDQPQDSQENQKPGDQGDNPEQRQPPSQPQDDKRQPGDKPQQDQPPSKPKEERQPDQPQAPEQPEGKQQQQPPQAAQTAAEEQNKPDETQQANEAWLKRIPDDPGGLLRRKFQYQYQQRRRAPTKE